MASHLQYNYVCNYYTYDVECILGMSANFEMCNSFLDTRLNTLNNTICSYLPYRDGKCHVSTLVNQKIVNTFPVFLYIFQIYFTVLLKPNITSRHDQMI